MGAKPWRNVALAAAAGAAVVLIYFSGWLLSPFLPSLFSPAPHPLPYTLAFGVVAAGAALAASVSAALSGSRDAVVRVLAATAFVYLCWRAGILWEDWLATLPLSPPLRYWAYDGPGAGAIGALPSALLVLLGGRYLFGMSVRQQWNGRLSFARRDLLYGGGVGVALAGLIIAGVALAGAGRVAWEPDWSSNGVNLFSNLYEEILARGLLLQVARREGGDRFGMFWTGIVFGSMHGLTWLALAFALVTWIIAWVVLRAGSLWAGWVFHQVIDVLVDSCVH
jgi:membrane protease YdiL (CAAX protease family)